MMTSLVKIGRAAEIMGTTPATLRNWELTGELLPTRKTQGGTRYYDVEQLMLNNYNNLVLGYTSVNQKDSSDSFSKRQNLLKSFLEKKNGEYKVLSSLSEIITYITKTKYIFTTYNDIQNIAMDSTLLTLLKSNNIKLTVISL